MSQADLAGRIDTVEHRMEALGDRLDEPFTARGRELRSEIAGLREVMRALHGDTMCRFDRLERAIAESAAETRRLMKVLHEETLSRIALLGEGRRPS